MIGKERNTHFQHPIPSCCQDLPHKHDIPKYGARVQYTKEPDTTAAIDVQDAKKVQEILGTLLYYAQAINSTMLPTIGTLATQQSAPTTKTMEGIKQLLNYCASNPNAIVRYQKSDTVLHAESNASYLSETKA
mmetsp:Transcript_26440/g.37543  ORF Transcript_26440/g.37543 Transcript_26440/m.37543 type:complete len:133 (-) Transcript_26440:204-602(-)